MFKKILLSVHISTPAELCAQYGGLRQKSWTALVLALTLLSE